MSFIPLLSYKFLMSKTYAMYILVFVLVLNVASYTFQAH
jgi:hypothetical protein